jgi:hypothetical protein
MGISGDLGDVSVAEVMQFIHFGRRTGTLVVNGAYRRAEVVFHKGRIVRADEPGTDLLGRIILKRKMIDRDTLAEAIHIQQTEKPRRSIGLILVRMGAITKGQLRSAVTEQIEGAVYELVTWKEGDFHFQLDEFKPIDDIGMEPGEILPEINIDTQMVVLEALRIFDEKNRDRSVREKHNLPPPTGEEDAPTMGVTLHQEVPVNEVRLGGTPLAPELRVTADEVELEDPLRGLAIATLKEPSTAERARPETARAAGSRALVQIVTEDDGLFDALRESLMRAKTKPERVRVTAAGAVLPGGASQIVVLDLRQGESGVDQITDLCRAHPRASLIAIADRLQPTTEAFRAGAVAVVPPEADAISAVVRSMLRIRVGGGSRPVMHFGDSGFAKLRKVVTDLGSGLLSATVALNLMNVISESVERAIMFLVQRTTLITVGAFGFGVNGKPLAEAMKGLRIDLVDGGVLTETVADGLARSVSFEAMSLCTGFAELVGPPVSGQAVLFPVLGSEDVIAVIYADNGAVDEEIEEIEILEMAAAQVGIAFENELMRRRLAN